MIKLENEKMYRDLYAEICGRGYISRDEIAKKYKGHAIDNIYRALDNLGLFTYDEEIEILNKKGKSKKIMVIKSCDMNQKDV